MPRHRWNYGIEEYVYLRLHVCIYQSDYLSMPNLDIGQANRC